MNSIQKTLVSLTAAALFSQKAALPKSFSAEDFDSLYRCARENGVLALCLDGIQQLPAGQQPPKNRYLKWVANVAYIEKRYAQKRKVLDFLLETYRARGIRCLTFKGFSVSRLYPVPNHREFGDLDIYLFDQYAQGNQAVSDKGIQIQGDDAHHAQYHIDGILVENHPHFLHTSSRLEEKLEAAAWNVREKQEEDPLFLPPLEQAAYIACHTAQHFFSNDCNIRLRALCDWAVILKEEGKNWHYTDLQDLLKDTKAESLADLMTLCCHQWYGQVSAQALSRIETFPTRIQKLFQKTVFAPKYQKKDEKRKWKRYWGHLYKQLHFASLRRYLSRKHTT